MPLDPTYPQERLKFIVQDARPAAFVTKKHLLPILPVQTAPVICLDAVGSMLSGEATTSVDSGVQPSNLVYVIYTSGSTGVPKGILIEHRSLVNYAEFARVTYKLQTDERVLQFASINFDTSAEEIFPTLLSGATLVVRTDDMLNSMSTFLRTCEQWKITMLDLPTAYWHELTLRMAEKQLTFPPRVRVVLIGGERALPERLLIWQQHVDHSVRLFNTYGPTETTIVATVAELAERQQDTPDIQPKQEIPIGKPVANTQIYLLDTFLQPVTPGTAGEMYIGGAGLARGYHERPELNAKRFIANPFNTTPGTRLYKTGDLARYLPDGELVFLGRVDSQVKIRGFRIEPGEIESVLRQHPGIREAVVLAREDIPGDKRLVAYVTPRAEHTYTSRDLRLFLKEHLPDYMIPSAFVLLTEVPLTPNGKIDQHALMAPTLNDVSRENIDEPFVTPTSMLHRQLIAIWEELLGVQSISIHDDFFELGGHSLLAVRLVDRIEQVWGRRIPPTALLGGATIEHLADILSQADLPVNASNDGINQHSVAQHKGFSFSIRSLLSRSRSSSRAGKSPVPGSGNETEYLSS